MAKDKILSVKITAKEDEMKSILLKKHDINISSLARRAIRDKYYEFYPEQRKEND